MARPLPPSQTLRGGANGSIFHPASPAALQDEGRPDTDTNLLGAEGDIDLGGAAEEAADLERLRGENAQLRTLCGELEQALHEATQQPAGGAPDDRLREF